MVSNERYRQRAAFIVGRLNLLLRPAVQPIGEHVDCPRLSGCGKVEKLFCRVPEPLVIVLGTRALKRGEEFLFSLGSIWVSYIAWLEGHISVDLSPCQPLLVLIGALTPLEREPDPVVILPACGVALDVPGVFTDICPKEIDGSLNLPGLWLFGSKSLTILAPVLLLRLRGGRGDGELGTVWT